MVGLLNSPQQFFQAAQWQRNPIRVLTDFIEREERNKAAQNFSALRFVGYVLNISYKEVTVITSDPFKDAVGGIPRNSFLIVLPDDTQNFIPHFTLIRVKDVAPTPLDHQVQQTFFELQKRSMPELDVFTQSELQWGALRASVLGVVYPHPEDPERIEFSADMNNFLSAHRYRVFKPDNAILDLITNQFVDPAMRFQIGTLRLTENRLHLHLHPPLPPPFQYAPPVQNESMVPVYIATRDFMGTRTALFGKTRLGKSNIIKLIAQSLITATHATHNVGQLIFDINGEYANDNPQDNNLSLASNNPGRCQIYALTPKPNTPSRPLKLNFYENPEQALPVLRTLLEQDKRLGAQYVASFASVELPALTELFPPNSNRFDLRAKRKVLLYWAILKKAGFTVNEKALLNHVSQIIGRRMTFNPEYHQGLRAQLYPDAAPPNIRTLDALIDEFQKIAEFKRMNPADPVLRSTGSGEPLFDADDEALLGFLIPETRGRGGPRILQPYRSYHDPEASNFVEEILELLAAGQTVIVDLGNAHPELMAYFSAYLSHAVFFRQVQLFSTNQLGNHYIQMYFEEAHNLFPVADRSGHPDIYQRLAKEGAKYHIGIVYATQSPTTINKDLIAQTENFFVVHISSRKEVNYLSDVNVAFEQLQEDILTCKTVGYTWMLTRSHRFVIPVQAVKFEITSQRP